jgi:dethiobiotin synthase
MNNRTRGFFVTGTGTDIGKTYACRMLADALAGPDTASTGAAYMKPVQTGCSRDASGTLRSPDFDYVMKGRAVMTAGYEQHVPYRFEHACSPHLAACRAGTVISPDVIKTAYTAVAARKLPVIVEGAGGLLVPLSDRFYIADLILHLRLPSIVVTSSRLGTLNHTLLTLRALRDMDIVLAGIIFTTCTDEPRGYIDEDNRKMIREYTRPIPFLEVPYGGAPIDSVREFWRGLDHCL